LHWLKEKKPNWKVITALALAFVITFAAIAILVRKGDVDKNASFVENLPAVADGFLWYALGGLVGFDTIYHHPTQIEANQNLDRYFRVIAKKFDNRIEVPPVHSEYVTIGPGGNMNVYTAYFSYYPQLGFFGTTLVLLLLGAFLVWTFLAAQSRNPQAAILFSVLFAGLVLTGYAENLLLNLNFLAKMFFVTWLMYRFRFQLRTLHYAASTATLA
jgi:oligosaccharide repeat unit polymerase